MCAGRLDSRSANSRRFPRPRFRQIEASERQTEGGPKFGPARMDAPLKLRYSALRDMRIESWPAAGTLYVRHPGSARAPNTSFKV
jgi:hypothetical protein